MTYDQSKGLSHSMCIWNSLNLETNFSNQNIISFNPWINHILLYVVDSTNRQCNPSHFDIFDHAFAALLSLWDFNSCLVSWLQPSLPIFRNICLIFIFSDSSLWTCSSNQELGSLIVKYKHMVLICLDLWTIHSEY